MNQKSSLGILRYYYRALAVVAALAGTAIGCTDSVNAPEPAKGADPYAVLRIDPAFTDAYSELPSFDEVIVGKRSSLGKLTTHPSTHHDTAHHGNPPADTSHHPPADTSHNPPADTSHHPPADTSHHPPADTSHNPHHDTTGHDSTHHAGHPEQWRDISLEHDIAVLRPHSFSHAPSGLHLTHTQDSLFMLALSEHRASLNTVFHQYMADRRERLAVLNAALHELHDAMRLGTISHDAGQTEYHRLIRAYKSDVELLTADLRARVTAAAVALDVVLRAFLDDAQWEKWLALKG